MKISHCAQAYLAIAALLFLAENTFKVSRYSLPILTPGVFLIWLKVNVVTFCVKWLTVSGLGYTFAWTAESILVIGFALGAIITIATLPRFKLLFLIDQVLNRIIGKKADKPS